jgi:hypothetical protein
MLEQAANKLDQRAVLRLADPDLAPTNALVFLVHTLNWRVGQPETLSSVNQRIILKKIPRWYKHYGKSSVAEFSNRGVVEDIVWEYFRNGTAVTSLEISINWRGEITNGFRIGTSRIGRRRIYRSFPREYLIIRVTNLNGIVWDASIKEKLIGILNTALPPFMIYDLIEP